jgi:type I restriction enzyme, R subunit
MSGKLTETAIEDFAIQLFVRQGYIYIHGPTIAPDSDTPERSRYDEVILTARLQQALHRINPTIAPDILQTALKELQRIQSPDC